MYPAWANHCKNVRFGGIESSARWVWAEQVWNEDQLRSFCCGGKLSAKSLFWFYFTLWLIPKGLRQEPADTRVHGRFCALHPDTTDCQVGWKAMVVRVVSDTHWISGIGDLNNSLLWIVRRLLSLVIAFTFHRVRMRRQLSWGVQWVHL